MAVGPVRLGGQKNQKPTIIRNSTSRIIEKSYNFYTLIARLSGSFIYYKHLHSVAICMQKRVAYGLARLLPMLKKI